MVISTILFIIMITTFISYVSFIWFKYGIQNSISDSYYVLPDKINWLFVAFTWLFAFPAMYLGASYLMLFAGAGIALVGAAAALRIPIIKRVHTIGAIIGMSLGLLAMIFQFHMWYVAVAVILLSLLLYKLDKKHVIWWMEIIIFTGITIVLGFSLF